MIIVEILTKRKTDTITIRGVRKMSKEKKLKQEKGTIAVFAVATNFSLIFILGGVFAVRAANRKNQ